MISRYCFLQESLHQVFIHTGGKDYHFDDQIGIDIGAGGDSGSLVLGSNDNEVGGLYFAHYPGTKFGFANKWQNVEKHFNKETMLQFSYIYA